MKLRTMGVIAYGVIPVVTIGLLVLIGTMVITVMTHDGAPERCNLIQHGHRWYLYGQKPWMPDWSLGSYVSREEALQAAQTNGCPNLGQPREH